MYCFNSIDAGRSLQEIDCDIVKFTWKMELHNHGLALTLISYLTEMVRSFIGSMDYNQVILTSKARDADLEDRDDFFTIVYYMRGMVAYAFHELETVDKLTIEGHHRFKHVPIVSFEACQIYSFFALASISVIRAKKCKAASEQAHTKFSVKQ
jgi:hypothetical protein